MIVVGIGEAWMRERQEEIDKMKLTNMMKRMELTEAVVRAETRRRDMEELEAFLTELRTSVIILRVKIIHLRLDARVTELRVEERNRTRSSSKTSKNPQHHNKTSKPMPFLWHTQPYSPPWTPFLWYTRPYSPRCMPSTKPSYRKRSNVPASPSQDIPFLSTLAVSPTPPIETLYPKVPKDPPAQEDEPKGQKFIRFFSCFGMK
ncbi:uncharacterized protein LOC142497079 isoform X2 [Ascaphus truei]|uniref:uncharacterized protein LOC142497079 isoform X2 n=1 Tax=Ascaphus truei TaxID=8439 RepID=UPI003F59F8C1